MKYISNKPEDAPYLRGTTSEDYVSALKEICRIGNIEIVKIWIYQCETIYDIETGLRIACKYGHIEIVKILFKRGGMIIQLLLYGMYRACQNHHIETAISMLPYIDNFYVDGFRIAAQYGYTELGIAIVDYIIKNKSDPRDFFMCSRRHLSSKYPEFELMLNSKQEELKRLTSQETPHQ